MPKIGEKWLFGAKLGLGIFCVNSVITNRKKAFFCFRAQKNRLYFLNKISDLFGIKRGFANLGYKYFHKLLCSRQITSQIINYGDKIFATFVI